MTNGSAQELPNHDDNLSGSHVDYLERAAKACEEGDMVLGMHLYLAAYEKAAADPRLTDDDARNSLQEAWHLACDLRERSMAEYVFEKMEPYLDGDEVQDCASQLQDLALDRLEEFGLSREDLEDMAEMISKDLMDVEPGMFNIVDAASFSFMPHSRSILPTERSVSDDVSSTQRSADADDADAVTDQAAVDGQTQPVEQASLDDANSEQQGSALSSLDAGDTAATSSPSTTEISDEKTEGKSFTDAEGNPLPAPGQPLPALVKLQKTDKRETERSERHDKRNSRKANEEVLNYSNLVGYDEAVGLMHDIGVGMADDPEFIHFVETLNQRHGVSCMPALDSLLFRAEAPEDALRFVEATIGELNLPALRMSMEENIQGIPVLCVTTQSNRQPKLNQVRNRFEGPAVLVLEGLDMWTVPQMPEAMEGIGSFMMANISRGARAALDLIHSAVEDPNVYVLATAQAGMELEPFFYDLLEPLSIIEIGYPTEKERRDIWFDIVSAHPSMRTVNRVDLMRYSKDMARYDIYMAVRDAVEDAYKLGLVTREYVPVSPQMIFERLAAFHSLDSSAYKQLEDAIVRDFQRDLENIDDLLNADE